MRSNGRFARCNASRTAAWELLAVDYASPDGRNECLQSWARRDPRIHFGDHRPQSLPGGRPQCGLAARTRGVHRLPGPRRRVLSESPRRGRLGGAGERRAVVRLRHRLRERFRRRPPDCLGAGTGHRPFVRGEHRCSPGRSAPPLDSWSGWADSTNCFGGARTGTSGSGSPGRACASGCCPGQSGASADADDRANAGMSPTPWQLAMFSANREAGR